ncbi:MAG: tetratricopeptide repeat protein [Alphaproteobacteria bacterium]|nr:tetratricopeptide repeat protein [Alphaproteobacteria bacterium]
MYCYDVGCENLHLDNAARACAFASVFYNSGTKLMEEPSDKNHRERNETLRNLYKEYGDNITADMVRECFSKYPIVAPRSFGARAIAGASDKELADILGIYTVGGRGLWSRRWLEGQILMGNITPEDFLNLPEQSLYEFFRLMGETREVFWIGKDQDTKINMQTLPAFKQWIKNPVTHDGKTKFSGKTIGQMLERMNPTILAQFDDGKYELGDIKQFDGRPNVKSMMDSLYFLANADFLAGDYESAAEKFETLAEKNPNNAQIFNDLAATYNNMGEHERALAAVNHIIKEIKDKSAFAAAYYNAGVARESLGELDKALINYNKAIENGNKSPRVPDAIKRVELNKNLARRNTGQIHV